MSRPPIIKGAIRHAGKIIGQRNVSKVSPSESRFGSTDIAFIGLPDHPESGLVWLVPAEDGQYDVVGYFDRTERQHKEV